MLKKEITFTNLNGEKKTEVFYFNLKKSELVMLEANYPGGFVNTIMGTLGLNSETIKDKDVAKHVDVDPEAYKNMVINMVDTLILESVGRKSVDGDRFIKKLDNGRPYKDEFKDSEAYDELFMELLSKPEELAKFIQGILPIMPEGEVTVPAKN